MKRNTKILLVTISLFFFFIVGYRFYGYMVQKDYVLYVNTACDPNTEACFDPNTDASVDETPYKKVEITAKFAPACLGEHSCEEEFTCDSVSEQANCSITYCSEDTLEDGEQCYTAENAE